MAVRKSKGPHRGKRRALIACPECGGLGHTRQGQNLKLEVPRSSLPKVRCKKCNGRGKLRGKARDHIDVLYDGIVKKDMTRTAFRRAYKRVMDERRAASDLNRILHRNEIARFSKGAIDAANRL